MKRACTTRKEPKRLPLPVGNSDWAHVVEHDWHRAVFAAEDCIETARAFHRRLCIEQITPRNFQRALGILAAAAKKARWQIDEKRYAAEMEVAGIVVLKYGIGFSGKHVALAAQTERSSVHP